MTHWGVSAPSNGNFTHRVAFEDVSGHRVLIQSGLGNRGRSACGTTHRARLEFPREAGLILRCAGKAGNPFQNTQGNRLSCRDDTIEQNDNKFDGIINNTPETPTVDALEAKAKAGEPISLVDLANAIKAEQKGGKGKPKEEKQSIRAQLKKDTGKEKAAPKKAATKKKNNDLEV